MIKVGITATRKGLTIPQKRALISLLRGILHFEGKTIGAEFHHGDCDGGDYQSACVADWLCYATVSHPPIDDKLRACHESDIVLEPKDYIERNHDIVDVADIMIACPKTEHEELRSGTWATIRYADMKEKDLRIILPNGNIVPYEKGM